MINISRVNFSKVFYDKKDAKFTKSRGNITVTRKRLFLFDWNSKFNLVYMSMHVRIALHYCMRFSNGRVQRILRNDDSLSRRK